MILCKSLDDAHTTNTDDDHVTKHNEEKPMVRGGRVLLQLTMLVTAPQARSALMLALVLCFLCSSRTVKSPCIAFIVALERSHRLESCSAAV